MIDRHKLEENKDVMTTISHIKKSKMIKFKLKQKQNIVILKYSRIDGIIGQR